MRSAAPTAETGSGAVGGGAGAGRGSACVITFRAPGPCGSAGTIDHTGAARPDAGRTQRIHPSATRRASAWRALSWLNPAMSPRRRKATSTSTRTACRASWQITSKVRRSAGPPLSAHRAGTASAASSTARTTWATAPARASKVGSSPIWRGLAATAATARAHWRASTAARLWGPRTGRPERPVGVRRVRKYSNPGALSAKAATSL